MQVYPHKHKHTQLIITVLIVNTQYYYMLGIFMVYIPLNGIV